MGYLSEALKKYYKQEGKTLLFNKDISLSNLSLQMWENLGFHKVDASVLSRVLKGKRLFTPSQLQVFCHILAMPKSEEEFLFQCLSKDYFQRDNVTIDSHLVSENDLFDIFESLASHATKLFYKGESQQVIQQSDTINTLYEKISPNKLSKPRLEKLFEAYGYFIFLKERSVAGTVTQHIAAQSIISTAHMLTALSEQYQLKNLYSYAQILFADVWYMYGSYSTKQQTENFKKAILHSSHAFSLLEDGHTEKLSALRILIASACYIRDDATIQYAERAAQTLLPIQPSENITNVIHLSKTITKGNAISKNADPFAFEEKVVDYFGERTPQAISSYFELSNIKTRLETLELLKLHDKNILLPLIQKGIELTQQGDYPRHKIFFEKQLKQLS